MTHDPDRSEGWKEAALAWEICASIHREYAQGQDAKFKAQQADFLQRAAEAKARMREIETDEASQ
jgi:hypothetical protein